MTQKILERIESLVNNEMNDTLESIVQTMDFDEAGERLIRGELDDKNDDLVSCMKSLIHIAQYIETDTTIDSIMTDDTYDRLLAKYKELSHDDFIGTPIEEISNRKLTKHDYPEAVGTLHKVHFVHTIDIPKNDSRKSLEQWVDNINKVYDDNHIKDKIVMGVSYKHDGVSAVFEFDENCKLIKIVTRRDTDKGLGVDITHIVKDKNGDIDYDYLYGKLFNDLDIFNQLLDAKTPFCIKTEIMVYKNDLEAFNKTVSPNNIKRNHRSCATSIINTDEESYDTNWKYYLTIQPLQVSVNKKLELNNESGNWTLIGTINGRYQYICPDIILVNKEDCDVDNIAECGKLLRDLADSMGQPIDGIVVSVLNENLVNLLGRSHHKNNFQVALKFAAGTQKTKLKKVSFSVGKIAGTITPIAEVEPVVIMGNTISNVGLSNYKKLDRLHLHEGDEVIVQYDIVPKLLKDDTCTESNNELITGPKECPICGQPLTIEGDVVRCKNIDCPSRFAGRVFNYIAKTGIDGIGMSTIYDLIDLGCLKTIGDLYRLDRYKNDIINMQGYGDVSYNNIITNIDKRRLLYPHEILGSIGIPDIGLSTMEKICREIPIHDLLSCQDYVIDKMISIKGIGDNKAMRIMDGIMKLNSDIQDLLSVIDIKEYSNDVPTKAVLFTGVRDKDFCKFLCETNNLKEADSLTQDVVLVIRKDDNTNTTKVKSAKEKNISIMNIDDAKKHFNYKSNL